LTKRVLALLLLVVCAASCFNAKKAAQDAQTKVQEKGACLILNSLQQNYSDARNGSALSAEAANQFRNGLEALKPLVPPDVQQAATVLRSPDAPIDPSQYTPQQAEARKTLDNYFVDKCGKTLK
jgi:hypothetical protein